MAGILFSFPGSHLEGAPNGGKGFNVTIDEVPPGMRVPCIDEEVTILAPDGAEAHFRVHVVLHVFQPEQRTDDTSRFFMEPYTYVVIRYGR